MAEYGITINNSAGVPIIDYRHRNMEIVAFGSVSISGANDVKTITFPACEAPLLWLRANPNAFMYRSQIGRPGGAWQTSVNVTADRATTLYYIITGFRIDTTMTGWGIGVRDAAGRVCFASSRRYLRMAAPPLSMPLVYNGAPNERWWQSQSWSPDGVTTFPAQVPNFNTTYFSFGALEAYANNGFNHWYLGFGLNYGAASMQIVVSRRSAPISLNADWGINAWQPSSSGVMDPRIFLAQNFTP